MLQGNSGVGKTSTINLVYDKFIESGAQIVEQREQAGGNVNDFTCMLKYNNLLIAICSMGDFAKDVIGYIDTYDEKNADILICACNSKFIKPVDKIKNYEHIIIEKTTFEHVNTIDANKILKEFELELSMDVNNK